MVYPDFEEFIASLNAHKVRYLVIGGYALAYHAEPRATKDIDIWIESTPANAKRARKAVEHFLGTSAPNITEEKFLNPRTLIVLGVAPVRIDILTSILGVHPFAAAWKRRAKGVFGRVPTNYLSLEDLIAAKSATPEERVQDKADLIALKHVAKQKHLKKS